MIVDFEEAHMVVIHFVLILIVNSANCMNWSSKFVTEIGITMDFHSSIVRCDCSPNFKEVNIFGRQPLYKAFDKECDNDKLVNEEGELLG